MIDPFEVVQTLTFAECGNLLVRMRRAICHSLALRDSWVEHSRIARRALSRLNGAGGAHLIFVRRAIGAEYAEARQRIREANAVLREGGQHLIRIGDVIDRSATFEQRCNLLGVNPAPIVKNCRPTPGSRRSSGSASRPARSTVSMVASAVPCLAWWGR